MRLLGPHLFTICLKTRLTNNNNGQGRTWHKSAKERKDMDRALATSMVLSFDENGTGYYAPFSESLAGTQLTDLVAIVITRVLAPRQKLMDVCSLGRGNSKAIIDAVVGSGLLKDDNPKYLALTIFQQDDTRRELDGMVELAFYQTINGSLPITPEKVLDTPTDSL